MSGSAPSASSPRARLPVGGTRLSGQGLPRDAVAADQRRRIQAGAITAFANHGYAGASIGRIIEPARVSRRTFYELFAGKEDAFLRIHEEALADLTARVSVASAAARPWPRRVAAAISAATELAAASPERGLLLAGDEFAAGPWTGHVHDTLLARFGPPLRHGRALSSPAKPPTLEAAVIGGIAAIVADRLRTGRAQELPGLDAQLAEFALIPYVGLEAAHSAPRGENVAAQSLE